MIKQAPNWTWKAVSVSNLKKIQDELIPLVKKLVPDWETHQCDFIWLDLEKIKAASPEYVKLIDKLGLQDRWQWASLITTNDNESFPIHTDVYDINERCFAFNIPLINCEDSYTVWYDAPDTIVNIVSGQHPKSIHYNELTAVEVDRMPATTCAFINIHKPHRPVTMHNKFRAILSSRFDPELHDYF